MYVSLSRLRVPELAALELIVACRARARLVEYADGFIDLQIWQSDLHTYEVGAE
jgi:heme-degrading monooxygenase HmoA